MAAKQAKSSSAQQVHDTLTLALPFNSTEDQVEDWLNIIQDFCSQWKSNVDLIFIDLTAGAHLKTWLSSQEIFDTLTGNHSCEIISDLSYIGQGLKKAVGLAKGQSFLIWSGENGIKPQVVKDWANQYKKGFPNDTVLKGERPIADKNQKQALEKKAGKGFNWFTGFTTTRVSDPVNPVMLLPTKLAHYLFQQIPGSSPLFQAEVLHQAEMEGIPLKPFRTNEGNNSESASQFKVSGIKGFSRAMAFKWNHQIKQPLKAYFNKGLADRPENLKDPQVGPRLAFSLLLIGLFLAMPFMSFDYGATGDEKIQDDYGQKVVKFYTSLGQNTSATTFKGTYRYGGLFEFFGSGAANIVDNFTEDNYRFETRHVLNALFGFLIFLFGGLLGRYFGGWRGGLLVLLFLILSPRLFGHTFNNPKDIPFAAAYIMGVYFLIKFLKEFPNPTKRVTTWLIVAIAFSINIRVGGLLLICYFGLFGLLELVKRFYWEGVTMEERSNLIRRAFRYGLLVVVLGYLGGTLFWPYALLNPIANPFKALSAMSDYPVNISILFEGQMINSRSLPWDYIFKYLWITTPIFGLLGFGLFLVGIPKAKSFKNAFYYFVVFFAAAFPIAYIIYLSANLYDGMRQVLFIYPPIMVMGGLAFNHLYGKLTSQYGRWSLTGLLVILMSLPLIFMIRNHPHQYVYFNQIIGGVERAFAKYEMDYWGHSGKHHAKWLGKQVTKNGQPNKKIKFRTNFTQSVRPVLKRYSDSFDGQYTSYRNRSKEEWDYAIFIARFISPAILENYWPPKGTVHEEKVDGQPISILIKRPSHHDYKGFQHLEKQEFREAIADFEKYLEADAQNASVLSALGRCYLQTKQINKAQEKLQQALNINSSDAMAIMLMGQIHYQKREPRKALQYFNTLRQVNPRLYQRAQDLVKRARQMMRQQQ